MTFLYLNSNEMGSGDPALGQKLLTVFLRKLADSDTPVNAIGCVNSGVFLTTREGPALECLRKLEARGARIASCGTCLEHFGIASDEVLVGTIGTMDQTVETMATAGRVLRP